MRNDVIVRFTVAYKQNCCDKNMIKKYPHIYVIKDLYDMILDYDGGTSTRSVVRFKTEENLLLYCDKVLPDFDEYLLMDLADYIKNGYVVAVKEVNMNNDDFISAIRKIGKDNETFIIVEDAFL